MSVIWPGIKIILFLLILIFAGTRNLGAQATHRIYGQVKQFFSVRGQEYPYPDYALNGIWQQEFEELPYFISASDIEKIEIVRSSAALLTGLSGIEGLISIRTRLSFTKERS